MGKDVQAAKEAAIVFVKKVRRNMAQYLTFAWSNQKFLFIHHIAAKEHRYKIKSLLVNVNKHKKCNIFQSLAAAPWVMVSLMFLPKAGIMLP